MEKFLRWPVFWGSILLFILRSGLATFYKLKSNSGAGSGVQGPVVIKTDPSFKKFCEKYRGTFSSELPAGVDKPEELEFLSVCTIDYLTQYERQNMHADLAAFTDQQVEMKELDHKRILVYAMK